MDITRMYSLQEAAAILGVTPATARRALSADLVRVGPHLLRVPRHVIARLIGDDAKRVA